jgi:hypothetical protein
MVGGLHSSERVVDRWHCHIIVVVGVVVVMVGGTHRLGDASKLKSEWSQSLAMSIAMVHTARSQVCNQRCPRRCGHQHGGGVVVVGGACGLRVLWGP